jgi:hypothetical protein
MRSGLCIGLQNAAHQRKENTMSDNKKPAAKVKIFPLSIAIWRHETEKAVFYSTSPLQRSYKDADGKWQNTDKLNEGDLLLGSKVLDLAHSEIVKLRASERNAQHEDPAA